MEGGIARRQSQSQLKVRFSAESFSSVSPITFSGFLGTTTKDTPEFYPGVPSLFLAVARKTAYCPAPVFSAGFSAGFFGAAASELPALGFQKSSALIHSAGT
jgi:hypothetical protein